MSVELPPRYSNLFVEDLRHIIKVDAERVDHYYDINSWKNSDSILCTFQFYNNSSTMSEEDTSKSTDQLPEVEVTLQLPAVLIITTEDDHWKNMRFSCILQQHHANRTLYSLHNNLPFPKASNLYPVHKIPLRLLSAGKMNLEPPLRTMMKTHVWTEGHHRTIASIFLSMMMTILMCINHIFLRRFARK
eukprot:scaffold4358_cov177-Ochromonas_danica.AAC.30